VLEQRALHRPLQPLDVRFMFPEHQKAPLADARRLSSVVIINVGIEGSVRRSCDSATRPQDSIAFMRLLTDARSPAA
jgi:hypothetical protein